MTPLRRGAALALLIASSVIANPIRAHAQTRYADEMIRRGLEMRRDGHDLAAFETFEAAFNLAPSPRARAQMGLAAQALGRWVDADRFVREALSATNDPWVTERRAVLQRSLAEIDAHLGRLDLRCNVDGATVRVDGAPRGTTPLADPLRLPAGTVTLQIGAPGYLEVTRQAVLAVGQTTREQIDLVAVPRVAEAVAPPMAPPVGPVAPPPRQALPPPPPVGVPSGASGRRVLAWTTGGVALAGVVAGAVALGLRNAEADAFNARLDDGDPANDCQRGSTDPECVDLETTVATDGAIATAGFVLGGVAAVTSAVLFATLPSGSTPTRAGLRGCAVTAGRGAAGLTCEIAF